MLWCSTTEETRSGPISRPSNSAFRRHRRPSTTPLDVSAELCTAQAVHLCSALYLRRLSQMRSAKQIAIYSNGSHPQYFAEEAFPDDSQTRNALWKSILFSSLLSPLCFSSCCLQAGQDRRPLFLSTAGHDSMSYSTPSCILCFETLPL